MAKKRDFGNVAEGFFSPQQPKPVIDAVDEKTNEKVSSVAPILTESKNTEEKEQAANSKEKKPSIKKKLQIEKKMGRPRANDLKYDDIVFKTSIYLTDETAFMIDSYALKKRIDRSEALRQLIRKNCKT